MRIFKNKSFARFARQASLNDGELRKAVAAIERGQVDADLGGGVLKQRVARVGGGKLGGFRTTIVFQPGERAFFMRGFAKNQLDNIRDGELVALRILAARLLAYDDAALSRAVVARGLDGGDTR